MAVNLIFCSLCFSWCSLWFNFIEATSDTNQVIRNFTHQNDGTNLSMIKLETSNSREILDLKKALSRPKEEILVEETELTARIETLNPENIYEENYKIVFKNHLRKTLDYAYILENPLNEINSNCLENTGRALFHAIGLKNAFEENPELYPALCSQPDFSANKTTATTLIDSLDNFNIYPNPSNGEFSIQVHEKTTMTIFSIEGKKVKEQILSPGINQTQSILPVGIYIIELKNEFESNKTKLNIVE